MTSTLDTVTAELFQTLYGLRSARQLAVECTAHGEHAEAARHQARASQYGITIRNIVRERRHGREAFRLATVRTRTSH